MAINMKKVHSFRSLSVFLRKLGFISWDQYKDMRNRAANINTSTPEGKFFSKTDLYVTTRV